MACAGGAPCQTDDADAFEVGQHFDKALTNDVRIINDQNFDRFIHSFVHSLSNWEIRGLSIRKRLSGCASRQTRFSRGADHDFFVAVWATSPLPTRDYWSAPDRPRCSIE